MGIVKNSLGDLFKDSDIDKKVLNWIGGIFAVIFSGIIFFTIYSDFKRGECTVSKESFYRLEYYGKIVRVKERYDSKHAVAIFEDGRKIRGFDYDVFQILKPGDILLKEKYDLDFKIVSGKDTLVFKDTIKDCEQFKSK